MPPHYHLSLIIATKDRLKELRTALAEIARQSVQPQQVIVVDASMEAIPSPEKEFPHLPLTYHRYAGRPSASAQRNCGVGLVHAGTELVGFLDDDITFAPDAIRNMMRFWETAGSDVAGTAFNLLNPIPTRATGLKRTRLTQWLGLYGPEMGRVMPSGWQTVIHTVPENLETDWLPSTASVWRHAVLGSDFFDPCFDGYSYLEDLDSSYSVRRRGHRLVVVADAGFYHWPSPSGRSSSVRFGTVETRNRLYLARKHGLSLRRCALAMFIRWGMSLATLDIGRAWGNLCGVLQYIRETGGCRKV